MQTAIGFDGKNSVTWPGSVVTAGFMRNLLLEHVHDSAFEVLENDLAS
jgi:hypothetical protein